MYNLVVYFHEKKKKKMRFFLEFFFLPFFFFPNVVNGHEIGGLVLTLLSIKKTFLQMLQVLLSGKLEYKHCSSRGKDSYNLIEYTMSY